MKKFNLLLLSLLTSCASYQSGNSAKLLKNQSGLASDNKITVTAFLDKELSTDYFSYVQVEFGNNSEEWVDIEKVFMKYEGKTLKIVLGPRLVDWGRAIKSKVSVDRQNRQALLGSIAAIGAIGAVSGAKSGDFKSAESYLTLMSGAAIAMDVNELSNKITDIERAQIFPQTHLYSPFSLPPGLVSKRWMLIQHPANTAIDKFVFEVFYKNEESKTYSVPVSI